jgi:AraC-like DNA-binding protein/ligand-binding sensor protein
MERAIQFVFRGEVQSIFDHFTALFGIRIAFFSPDGSELRVGLGSPICRYCRLLREELGLVDTCRKLDRRRRAEAVAGEEMVAYRCHGGMTEAAVPVAAAGETIGFVMIGQFRTSDRPPAAMLRRWRRRHRDRRLTEAFLEAPYHPPERAGRILELLDVLVRFIASERMISVSERSPLEPLLSYIAEHPDEHLSLADAARMTYSSVSTLAHAFKREVGVSFKRYQIERRLERADEYLRTSPVLTVREVAAKLGYSDPLYFSRLYRRHRGYPPSAARRRRG